MLYNILSSPLEQRMFTNSRFLSYVRSAFFLSFILVSLIINDTRLYGQPLQGVEPGELTGHENHSISLNDAAALTRNFRSSEGNQAATVLGEYFGKNALIAALNQDKCIGLRIYYGMKNDGTPALVLVGVDNSGKDITSGLVLEHGYPCPPICDSRNSLTDYDPPSVLSELNSSPESK